MYLYVYCSTQMSKDNYCRFFPLPPVSTTPVVHLELQISPRIFEKIWNGLNNGILKRLGGTDSRENPEVENLLALSFYCMCLGLTYLAGKQDLSVHWGWLCRLFILRHFFLRLEKNWDKSILLRTPIWRSAYVAKQNNGYNAARDSKFNSFNSKLSALFAQ